MHTQWEALANTHILGIAPYEPGKPIEELEREFGVHDAIKLASNENPLPPSERVQRAIPEDAALIEWFHYHPFNAKAKGQEQRWGTARYVAYVLKRKGQPVAVDLGEATPIERTLSDLLVALREPGSTQRRDDRERGEHRRAPLERRVCHEAQRRGRDGGPAQRHPLRGIGGPREGRPDAEQGRLQLARRFVAVLGHLVQRLRHPALVARGRVGVDGADLGGLVDAPHRLGRVAAAIEKLAKYCRENDIRLYIANQPELRDPKNYPFPQVDRMLEKIADANKVPYIPLLPTVRDLEPESLWVTRPDPQPASSTVSSPRTLAAVFRFGWPAAGIAQRKALSQKPVNSDQPIQLKAQASVAVEV